MPTVSFQRESHSYEVPNSCSLLPALRELGKELPQGCLKGSCGTCRIEIVEGIENISPADKKELDTIASLLANYRRMKGDNLWQNKNIRLACRIKVLGDVEIKLLG